MSNEENIIRKTQRKERDLRREVKKAFENSEVKRKVLETTQDISGKASEAIDESGIKAKLKPVEKAIKSAFKTGKETIKKANEVTGVTQKLSAGRDKVIDYTVAPTIGFFDEVGITDKVIRTVDETQSTYGNIRHLIKPYFKPESAMEILTDTKKQLTKITACILQISDKEAANWMGQFSKVFTAKFAGVLGTASLFGLVSTFGTASTGTAIVTLHGAAATNATIATLGFGGGMATGALVLSGFGLAMGMLTYKVLSSTPRDFDDLDAEEKSILETCGLLVAAIEEKIEEKPLNLYSDEAIQFRHVLEQLYEHLVSKADKVCANLDAKKSFNYRQKILPDFEPIMIKGFDAYAANSPLSPEAIVAGVFYGLLTRSVLDGSVEETLVLDAIRRSNTDLNGVSEADISDYLSGLSPEKQRGVANNVKGIYHELISVEKYNADNTDTYAELHSATNHPGSDVVIRSTDTDEIIAEYQLKATDSKSYVTEHQDRYSDIEIMATEEVASQLDNVSSSGITNKKLTETVNTVSDNLADNTLSDRMTEAGEYSGFTRAGFEALKVLDGKTTISQAGKQTFRVYANAAAATGITAYLFG